MIMGILLGFAWVFSIVGAYALGRVHAYEDSMRIMEGGEVSESWFARLHCQLVGHDFEFVKHDPRPREYRPDGQPKLRKALARCARCGVTNE